MTNIARRPGPPLADTVYRDGALGARVAIRHLTNEHRRELERIAPAASAIYAARVGRIAGGIALLAGALSIVVVLIAGATAWLTLPQGTATVLLLASWPFALIARAVGKSLGLRRFGASSYRELAMCDEAYPDLVRMRRLDVAARIRALVGRAGAASVGLPLAGVALLAPLTLHFGVLAASGVSLAGFDEWIVLSAILAGHCHIVLAAMSWRFGRIAVQPHDPAAGGRWGWQAWRVTVAASFFPGAFLIGIPVFVVGFTGLFVPVMFAVSHRLVHREQCWLEQCADRSRATTTATAIVAPPADA